MHNAVLRGRSEAQRNGGPSAATTALCYVDKGRCASRTEYTPKLYSLARTTDATIASENAVIGVNETAKAVNKTPNAPNFRCKLAELVNSGFAIGTPLLT